MPAAGSRHRGDGLTRHKERPEAVDAQDGLDVRGGSVGERRVHRLSGARVVHNDVHAAQGGHRALHHGLDVGRRRDVGHSPPNHGALGGGELLGGLVERGAVPADDADLVPELHELAGQSQSDSSAAAGDDHPEAALSGADRVGEAEFGPELSPQHPCSCARKRERTAPERQAVQGPAFHDTAPQCLSQVSTREACRANLRGESRRHTCAASFCGMAAAADAPTGDSKTPVGPRVLPVREGISRGVAARRAPSCRVCDRVRAPHATVTQADTADDTPADPYYWEEGANDDVPTTTAVMHNLHWWGSLALAGEHWSLLCDIFAVNRLCARAGQRALRPSNRAQAWTRSAECSRAGWGSHSPVTSLRSTTRSGSASRFARGSSPGASATCWCWKSEGVGEQLRAAPPPILAVSKRP